MTPLRTRLKHFVRRVLHMKRIQIQIRAQSTRRNRPPPYSWVYYSRTVDTLVVSVVVHKDRRRSPALVPSSYPSFDSMTSLWQVGISYKVIQRRGVYTLPFRRLRTSRKGKGVVAIHSMGKGFPQRSECKGTGAIPSPFSKAESSASSAS
jgi:hypothetical protein